MADDSFHVQELGNPDSATLEPFIYHEAYSLRRDHVFLLYEQELNSAINVFSYTWNHHIKHSVTLQQSWRSTVPMERFFSSDELQTGYLLEDGEWLLNPLEDFSRNSNTQEGELILLDTLTDTTSISALGDVNNDGYDELWIQNNTAGSIVLGGLEWDGDRILWTLEGSCQSVQSMILPDEDITFICMDSDMLFFSQLEGSADKTEAMRIETSQNSFGVLWTAPPFVLTQEDNQLHLIHHEDSTQNALIQTPHSMEYGLFMVQKTLDYRYQIFIPFLQEQVVLLGTIQVYP